MKKVILRNDVENLLREFGRRDEKVVVTGLDASGKTTILAKILPEYNVFKFDTNLSEVYLDERYPDSKWVCDYWKIYDRHPYIDYFVYDSVNRGGLDTLDEYIEKYRKEIIELKNYIVFLNDKFINIKPHEGLVHDKRDEIKAAFEYFINKLSDVADFYVVED